MSPNVIVRIGEELRRTVDESPFAAHVAGPKELHVVFLDGDAAAAIAGIDTTPYAPEQVVAAGRELHLHLPGGIGRSPLATALAKTGGPAAVGTTRGWRTVTTLAAMAAELD